ncbi:MAG: hypothetical protein Q4E16_02525 [Neisseria sp.]|nr:hypothetical protein [Neisseria sp.]
MDYQQALQHILTRQTDTIAPHTLANGEQVWVRRVGKTVPQWRYRLLGLIARTLKLGALTPVPNFGGTTALQTEAKRLQQLASQNINAPHLLAQVADGIMFSHLGNQNMIDRLQQADTALQDWQLGLHSLRNLHQQGGYLSQAFCRNIIYQNNGELGFIDFEDDPAEFMSLDNCQIRDYLCYLQSSIIWLHRHGKMIQAVATWQNFEATLPEHIRHQLRRTVHKIRWLRHIKSDALGKDTLRLATLAELFYLSQNPA